ncbi:MAG: hypothetical protein FWD09_02095 [Lentimicrobiaceae bacterium]|nr:hypothetical protein [Lentimicrobiaceae bacterium]
MKIFKNPYFLKAPLVARRFFCVHYPYSLIPKTILKNKGIRVHLTCSGFLKNKRIRVHLACSGFLATLGMTEHFAIHGGGKRGGANIEQIGTTYCRRVFRPSPHSERSRHSERSEESRTMVQSSFRAQPRNPKQWRSRLIN